MKKIIVLLLIIFCSCGENNSNNKKWTDSDVLCGDAEVVQISGNHNYFGPAKDIVVICEVNHNSSIFESRLTIDNTIIGGAHCPFKVGDIVVVKFLKMDRQKSVEMFLLKSVNNTTGYIWESLYTLDEACSGTWPEGSIQQKNTFSAKGKI